jgi:hypothetical protein
VQGGAVLREQRLVGRDDRCAVLHAGEDQRARRLDAADDLDHEVDVVTAHEPRGVGRDERGIDAARAVGAAHGDPGQLQRPPDPRGQVVGVFGEQARDLAPDDAAAEQRHP